MRDTPRDDLRKLSRLLAAKSTRIPSSSPRTGQSKRRASRAASFMNQDGSPAPEPPRMSLPRGEMADDDDSFHDVPPRMSVPLDEYDVEGGRREYRRERESLGRIQLSDFQDIAAGIIEETDDEDDEDDDLGPIGIDDDFSRLEPVDNETTHNLRALIDANQQDSDAEHTRHSFGANTDGETTFQFRIADRSRLSNVLADDAAEGAEEIAEEALIVQDNQRHDEDTSSQGSVDYAAALNEQLQAERSFQIPNSNPAPAPVIQLKSKTQPKLKQKKMLHRSRFGIEYPSLPSAVVKKLASSFSRSYGGNGKVNHETLSALTEASDWFLEQVSEDLAAYTDHARRKRIEEADVITLMKR
jgi:histone H3/H4